MELLGKPLPRLDAIDKVTGKALYPGDIQMDGQLFMKVMFANRVHAVIKKLDIREAEKYPGVVMVLTAKDVPFNGYGLSGPDQPVLCGPGSKKPYAERVRFIGDQVALVIAENEAIAMKAAGLIKVEYEDLPIVDDPREAIKEGALIIHPDKGNNIISHHQIRRGDVEAAFKQCHVVIEQEYHTPVQEHAFLQPEAGIAYLDKEERITVKIAGQWAHEDQEQIAQALEMPLEKIRVIYPAIGGAFGGREDMSLQIVLALAVKCLADKGIRRPVKTIWSREESMIGHHKRHPYFLKMKWGADSNGKLLAAKIDMIADGGAYTYTSGKVLGNATLLCTGPYEIPNVSVNADAVFTNNLPNGAFRGFGGPQAAFAAESQMNRLAEALKMDPVALRMKNVIHEGSMLSVNSQIPKGVSMAETIETCAKAGGWSEKDGYWQKPVYGATSKPHIRKGIGFACSYKNIGFSFGAPEKCEARVELIGKSEIEEAILYHAGADVGQGAHAAFIQMAAHALDIPVNKVKLVASDTLTSGNSGSASASRMTFMAGNAIKGACELALEKWKNEERPAIGDYVYRPPATTPFDKTDGHCMPNFAYGYVSEVAEVEVDMETGQMTIQRLICADEVGKAINRQQVEGQIEGCLVQAAGYAVLENFIEKNGQVLTRHLSTYLIPTILDIPDKIDSIILENKDPEGPWGARGMSEMPYLPLAPAITAALHDATGVWFNRFPLTAENVYQRLLTD